MSSRFISVGSIDATTGTPSSETPTSTTSTSITNNNNNSSSGSKSREWAEVTEQLEADRQRRVAQAKQATQEGGEKSLFEVLQANKAAKQAEFEEKSKLKNQFRALDEDEIDFLDEVKRRRREEEMQMKKELEEGLRAFKERRGAGGEGDGGESEEGEGLEEEGWVFTADSGRRRKRKGEGKKLLLVKKARRESTGEGKEEGEKPAQVPAEKVTGSSLPKPAAESAAAPALARKPGGGLLVDYGSDSDD